MGIKQVEILVQDLFILARTELVLLLDDFHRFFIVEDGVADPFDIGGVIHRNFEEDMEDRFAFWVVPKFGLLAMKMFDDFAFFGEYGYYK